MLQYPNVQIEHEHEHEHEETISQQPSLAVHKTRVRQDMVLGFLTRNERLD
jgi:hypothetical protein